MYGADLGVRLCRQEGVEVVVVSLSLTFRADVQLVQMPAK
jgi:hypothetical protein